MTCNYCKEVELTLEESKNPKKMCMFCEIEAVLYSRKVMKVNSIPLPNPGKLGRTQEEFDNFVARIAKTSNKLDTARESIDNVLKTSVKDLGSQDPGQISRPGAQPNFSDDDVGRLLKSYDPNEPPKEFYMAVSDDFYIKVVVPAPMSQKQENIYGKMIRKLFTDIVYTRIQGTFLEYFFKDPDETPQPPHPIFPPM